MSTQPCHNCEHVDGGGTVTVYQTQQPFCQDCGTDNNCLEKMDSKCVVYHLTSPNSLSLLENLGMPNGSTVEQILEAIDDLIGRNNGNIALTAVDTTTINLTTSGLASHTIKADLIISTDAGNILETRPNGVFVSSAVVGKVKVDANDPADYLINQLIGGSDGIISTTIVPDSGMLQVQPSLDITCLINLLSTNQQFINLICKITQDCLGTCATIGSIQTTVVNS
jgi:hypothetical protein